ncbi:hypothetical protein BDK51DRAFT_45456 [Blyttiomyces helicus]|uniref:Uncharacterized protein n=1 Tax=Blyttiomyces helicus TaxID=388810 RepID=A0A4P9WH25_9FUNG|nr:hypothetical protein BDK51DRAFT_45456 [Blyttiomyces helicus]|eukprot:RKO91662.1 hypothetical protein BDK51DRAFT_45456 [Blyttiomyces helicus]
MSKAQSRRQQSTPAPGHTSRLTTPSALRLDHGFRGSPATKPSPMPPPPTPHPKRNPPPPHPHPKATAAYPRVDNGLRASDESSLLCCWGAGGKGGIKAEKADKEKSEGQRGQRGLMYTTRADPNVSGGSARLGSGGRARGVARLPLFFFVCFGAGIRDISDISDIRDISDIKTSESQSQSASIVRQTSKHDPGPRAPSSTPRPVEVVDKTTSGLSPSLSPSTPPYLFPMELLDPRASEHFLSHPRYYAPLTPLPVDQCSSPSPSPINQSIRMSPCMHAPTKLIGDSQLIRLGANVGQPGRNTAPGSPRLPLPWGVSDRIAVATLFDGTNSHDRVVASQSQPKAFNIFDDQDRIQDGEQTTAHKSNLESTQMISQTCTTG